MKLTCSPTALSVLAAGLLCAAAPSASAQLLNTWNLSVFGNLTSTSEVEGRTQVLGNLTTGASNYGTMLTPRPNFLSTDVLRVGGNVNGGNVQMEAGNLRLGGIRTGNVNFNGGGVQISDNTTASQILSSRGEAYFATSALASLLPTGTINFPSGQPGGVNINAVTSGPDNIAVFNITTAQLASNLIQQIDISISGGGSVIINVSGSGLTFNAGNFVGNFNNNSVRSRVLWNFPQATAIDLQRSWSGSILAPYATLLNNTIITGAVAVEHFTQNGEVHRVAGINSGYSGFQPVPTPGAAGLLALGGLMALRRRR